MNQRAGMYKDILVTIRLKRTPFGTRPISVGLRMLLIWIRLYTKSALVFPPMSKLNALGIQGIFSHS